MALLLGIVVFLALGVCAIPSPQKLNSDISILINDDLQGPSSPLADSGVILLDSQRPENAAAACAALGEQLWAPELKTASIQSSLDYLKYQDKIKDSSLLWIAPSGNTTRAIGTSGAIFSVQPSLQLPVLCTQTAPFSNITYANTNSEWLVSVASNNETYVGYRDRLSFRFLGIRYAPQPERFTYSVPYVGSGQIANATEFGDYCFQWGSGSEDCLFLNVWTSYLPKPGGQAEKSNLKPVMFFIHGGAFSSGMGSDPSVDGGNLVARGDVVVVTINYRLGTFGFLALDDGITNGNFGFADQINALNWVRANIQDFGGDPDRITVFGQSAGAGSVRAMMASPKAVGKFAGAIPMSNLGGIGYGTTYSLYYTIKQEVADVADHILAETNCTDAASQVNCLRQLPESTFSSIATNAVYLVVDGTYLTSDQLQLNGPRTPYELMMGTMRDDGGPIISYPTITNLTEFIQSQGFPVPPASLFPEPTGPNVTLDVFNVTARLATDGIFRCIDEATVYAGLQSGMFDSVHYYEFNRSYQTYNWPNEDVCQPPITPTHPYGDPNLEYFKCHSGEIYQVFGQIIRMGLPFRDENDLPFEQFTLDTFSSFARTYDPNPDPAFLEARGYQNTLSELQAAGTWAPSVKGSMTTRILQWPSFQTGFREESQCTWLNLSLTYYT